MRHDVTYDASTDISRLIPGHKGDFDACHRLLDASPEQIRRVLPELLVWLQDINWPVAPYILKALRPLDAALAPPVMDILAGDDEMWKYWIISNLLPQARTEVRQALHPHIVAIAKQPTPGEAAEEVNLAAAGLLAQWGSD